MNIKTRITINGQEYGSLEEMPPDIRAQFDKTMGMFADRDGNGIPDILEGNKADASSILSGQVAKSPSLAVVKTSTRFVINGREIEKLADVPTAILQAVAGQKRTDSTPATPTPVFIRGGISFRLSWSLFFALVAAVAVAGAVVWVFR